MSWTGSIPSKTHFRAFLSFFNWTRTRLAARWKLTFSGQEDSPCCAETPCKRATWGRKPPTRSCSWSPWNCCSWRCSGCWWLCCWMRQNVCCLSWKASRAPRRPPCTRTTRIYCRSRLSCSWPPGGRSTWSVHLERCRARRWTRGRSLPRPARWLGPFCRWFWCTCSRSLWTASRGTSGPCTGAWGPL